MAELTHAISRRALTADEKAAVERDLARLAEIAEELAAKERLYKERLDIYRRLLGLTVYQRVIGEAAQVTDIAVAAAVKKADAEQPWQPVDPSTDRPPGVDPGT